MAQRLYGNASGFHRPRLWLATREGRRLPRPADMVAPITAPERQIEIEFEGLTLAEQRAALAAFPGGRRFVLKSDRYNRA
jgi:hypothetical protein